jgi:hypothetical protein
MIAPKAKSVPLDGATSAGTPRRELVGAESLRATVLWDCDWGL